MTDSGNSSFMDSGGEMCWYALRAFWNKTQPLIREVSDAGYRTYYALRTVEAVNSETLEYHEEPLLKSLFFIQCPVGWLQAFKQRHFSDFMVYTDKPGGKPAPIRDAEMEAFIMVTSVHNNNAGDIEVLEPKPQYATGDLVHVTDGMYKGATGIVKRIKKDRKLLVAITGVAVVAISHIPMCYLEKV